MILHRSSSSLPPYWQPATMINDTIRATTNHPPPFAFDPHVQPSSYHHHACPHTSELQHQHVRLSSKALQSSTKPQIPVASPPHYTLPLPADQDVPLAARLFTRPPSLPEVDFHSPASSSESVTSTVNLRVPYFSASSQAPETFFEVKSRATWVGKRVLILHSLQVSLFSPDPPPRLTSLKTPSRDLYRLKTMDKLNYG